MPTFKDRRHAGRLLAYRIDPVLHHGATVIALSWGGVPVALEIARWLFGPLGVMEPIPESIISGAEPVLGEKLGCLANTEPLPIRPVKIAGALDSSPVLENPLKNPSEHPGEPLPLRGRTVILVDDAITTGVSAVVLGGAIEEQGPRQLIIATPVGTDSTMKVLRDQFDEVIWIEGSELIDNHGSHKSVTSGNYEYSMDVPNGPKSPYVACSDWKSVQALQRQAWILSGWKKKKKAGRSSE